MKKTHCIIILLFLTHTLAPMVIVRTIQMPFKFFLNDFLASEVHGNDLDGVKWALELGADPCAKISSVLNCRCCHKVGKTILCAAITGQNPRIIKELINVVPYTTLAESRHAELFSWAAMNIKTLKLLLHSGVCYDGVDFGSHLRCNYNFNNVRLFAVLNLCPEKLSEEVVARNDKDEIVAYNAGKELYQQRLQNYTKFLSSIINLRDSDQFPDDLVRIIIGYAKVHIDFGDLLLDDEEREKKKLVPSECVIF